MAGVHCPFCQNSDTKVVDSRTVEDGQAIRRRRRCLSCEQRFTTIERSVLMIEKRGGELEEFDREKVIAGVRRACQGRDISDAKLKMLARTVEETLRKEGAGRSQGTAKVKSNQVGLAILDPLRDLDEIGYLRFASVYKSFSSAEDFEREIEDLRTRKGI